MVVWCGGVVVVVVWCAHRHVPTAHDDGSDAQDGAPAPKVKHCFVLDVIVLLFDGVYHVCCVCAYVRARACVCVACAAGVLQKC